MTDEPFEKQIAIEALKKVLRHKALYPADAAQIRDVVTRLETRTKGEQQARI